MHWFSVLVVFIITWWTVIFMILPFGVRVPDNPEAGHAPSAPLAPRIGKKMLITTIVSIVITSIIYVLVEAEVFSFRQWAETL
jgi:predicted secreted protein